MNSLISIIFNEKKNISYIPTISDRNVPSYRIIKVLIFNFFQKNLIRTYPSWRILSVPYPIDF